MTSDTTKVNAIPVYETQKIEQRQNSVNEITNIWKNEQAETGASEMVDKVVITNPISQESEDNENNNSSKNPVLKIALGIIGGAALCVLARKTTKSIINKQNIKKLAQAEKKSMERMQHSLEALTSRQAELTQELKKQKEIIESINKEYNLSQVDSTIKNYQNKIKELESELGWAKSLGEEKSEIEKLQRLIDYYTVDMNILRKEYEYPYWLRGNAKSRINDINRELEEILKTLNA